MHTRVTAGLHRAAQERMDGRAKAAAAACHNNTARRQGAAAEQRCLPGERSPLRHARTLEDSAEHVVRQVAEPGRGRLHLWRAAGGVWPGHHGALWGAMEGRPQEPPHAAALTALASAQAHERCSKRLPVDTTFIASCSADRPALQRRQPARQPGCPPAGGLGAMCAALCHPPAGMPAPAGRHACACRAFTSCCTNCGAVAQGACTTSASKVRLAHAPWGAGLLYIMPCRARVPHGGAAKPKPSCTPASSRGQVGGVQRCGQHP